MQSKCTVNDIACHVEEMIYGQQDAGAGDKYLPNIRDDAMTFTFSYVRENIILISKYCAAYEDITVNSFLYNYVHTKFSLISVLHYFLFNHLN